MTALAQQLAADNVVPRPRQAINSTSIRAAALLLGLLVGGGTLAILLAGDSPSQVTITLTLIYIAYASSWNLVAGFAGQFTFGHSAFFGLGAYTATLLTIWFSTPPLFGLWIGAMVAAAAAVAIGVITLKLRGLYFGLVTAIFPIVFAVFATYLGYQEVTVPFHPRGGVTYFSSSDPRVLSGVALCAAVLVSALSVVILRSRFGLFFGALRADQDAAEASGVWTTQVKVYALALSAALTAIAGSLYASVALVVTPTDVFGLQMSVKPVLFSVFGGIGTLTGPIIGALILVPLSEMLDATFGASLPGLSGMVYGLALLLVITIFPSGLVPVFGRIATFIGRRLPDSITGPSSQVSRWLGAGPDEIPAGPGIPRRAIPAVTVPSPAGTRKPVNPPILEIMRVAKAFGGTRVLHNVTMEVGHQNIVGVIGPNGAGKTTLFNIINGFLRPDAGTIRLSGQAIAELRPSLIARAGVGRTFQTVRAFSGMSAIDNVLVAGLVRHRARAQALDAAWEALEEVALADRAPVPVGELTTGELRRLELARAMVTAGREGLLLLDEFLGGMMKTEGAVLLSALERWRARGGSVLAIEHTMRAMVGFVDRFVVLNFGEVIAEGQPSEIWKNRDVIAAYLGEKWVA